MTNKQTNHTHTHTTHTKRHCKDNSLVCSPAKVAEGVSSECVVESESEKQLHQCHEAADVKSNAYFGKSEKKGK